MLRIGLVASTIPLFVLGLFARGELTAAPAACLMSAEQAVQITPSPGLAQFHVGFTKDARRASVHVQLVDTPENADFAIADDVSDPAADGCGSIRGARLVAITSQARNSDPLIYLGPEPGADYRIYVRSKHITPAEAAALVVAAGNGEAPMTTAALAAP
ncbi:hypothetical protein [Rhodopseudomonas sp. B29]|uniref:hypothetical protein n=1 Tax=Rhodopseudomonas sp. B29 TaxID=95607 RepID=UPI000344C576|nr:hypothetical protein [Rhodopseudomonas sp. B29]